jgi:DNA-binding HxlR family transcriptional regulator
MHNNQPDKNDAIVRKAEKLTTALYMVSDIVADREPIKWKMRETSVELLSDITLSGTSSSSERLSYLRGVVKKIEKMVSFLDIAMITRMVSSMNANLIRKEYIVLRDMIESDVSDLLGGKGFHDAPPQPMYRVTPKEEKSEVDTSTLVMTTLRPEGSLRIHSGTPVAVRTQSKVGQSQEQHERHVSQALPPRSSHGTKSERYTDDKFVPKMNILPQENKQTEMMGKNNHASETHETISHKEADTRIAKDDRRKIVLALLKQRPELTVKDIAKSIPGFSEKTIQRELVAMLEEGVLTKAGEKRWTTYSLVQGQ